MLITLSEDRSKPILFDGRRSKQMYLLFVRAGELLDFVFRHSACDAFALDFPFPVGPRAGFVSLMRAFAWYCADEGAHPGHYRRK